MGKRIDEFLKLAKEFALDVVDEDPRLAALITIQTILMAILEELWEINEKLDTKDESD